MFAVVGVAVGLVLWTALGQRLVALSRDSRVELRKVVWPTRQETMQITLIVLVLVFLIGLFLWLVDSLLFWGVQMITGQGA
jgi:preprotein translocase subunit SecE